MRLNAPKRTTWLISLALGALGLLGALVSLPVLTSLAFWFVLAGLVLSLLAAYLPNL